MKKTTSENLSKKLAKYGAFTAAIAGVASANGQGIYYSGILDGTAFNGAYNLDLDGDTNVDFQLYHYTTVTSGFYNFLLINRNFNSQNAILGSVVNDAFGTVRYPFALDDNALISSANPNWISDNFDMYINQRDYCYLNSNWCDGLSKTTNKYLGLKFEFNGEIHYGWARLEVGTDPSDWILKDYAYNTIAGEPIEAGQQTLGIEESTFSKLKIVALNKSIGLYNLPQSTKYELFSIAGQSVLKGKTNQNTYVIEANTLSNGTYVLVLQDANSNAILRKKIVL